VEREASGLPKVLMIALPFYRLSITDHQLKKNLSLTNTRFFLKPQRRKYINDTFFFAKRINDTL
jgi:hypothetical protein